MLVRSITITDQPVILSAVSAEPELLPTEAIDLPGYVEHDLAVPEQANPSSVELAVSDTNVLSEPRYTRDEFMLEFADEIENAREQARQEGHQQGHATGLEEGRTQGAAEFATKVDDVVQLLASLRVKLNEELDGITDLSIEIVYEAVTKILGAQLVHRDAVVATVREIVRRAKERTRLVARVAPHDLELLNAGGGALVEGLNVGNLELLADERVQIGGCLLETPAGNLDGRLEIQLQQLREALISARDSEG